MRAILLGLTLLLPAQGAAAGAWPRAEGTTFLALGQSASSGSPALLAPDQSFRSQSSVYAEYGLTERLTLGFDGAYGWGPEADLWTGLAFLRWPVATTPAGDRFALDLGLGRRVDSEEGADTRARLGLAWGRGFEIGLGQGWMGVESSAERLVPANDTVYKADFTIGLRPDDDWMLILQVWTGLYPRAAPLVRLAPSVVRRLGEHLHLQFGADTTVAGDRSYGVKLATWISF
ncbi:hypothetical protein [Amaricoccus solimangrovi]|uniref:Cellulose biosynthesis protein BcsS n=1 Tax=Amaricoccus solimangrovi TaxID=2589815 RepID=A0A501WKA7_9RHOB|nr:hypothetical protein [Amaricoccus solimangrovi]TPE49939.1 hypothetical protein FJM51_13370 [Amaricoccus solimangrovi]